MKLIKKLLLPTVIATLLLSACTKKEESTPQKNENVAVSSEVSEKKENSSDKSVNEEEQKATENGEFSKFTALDLDKKEYNQDILGNAQLTVINVWGTFCGPCLKEMPDLAKLSEEYKDKNVQFVGIVIDTLDQNGEYSEEQIKTAKKIIEQTGVKYLNLLPSPDLINSYLKTVQAIPVKLIVDNKGNILQTYLGAQTKAFFEEGINQELASLK